MIYLDSSALVKKYINEPGTDRVNSLLEMSEISATSRLAYPEILSAFARRYKAKGISTAGYKKVVENFESGWKYFLIVEMREEFMPITKKIIEKHGLKGADAVHLSSALWLKKGIKEDVVFVASDVALLNAAKAEKLPIENPIS